MTRSKVSSSDGSVSKGKGGAEIISSFQSLALNVLSLLLTTETIACSYMDLVPSLAHWIGELEADNQSAWIDAVQCLLYIFETVRFGGFRSHQQQLAALTHTLLYCSVAHGYSLSLDEREQWGNCSYALKE